MIKKSLRAYITCRQFVFFVLSHSKVFRVFCLQFLKQLVHRIFKFLIILSCLRSIDKFKQCGKILFVLRCFIIDVPNQGTIQKPFGL